MVATSFRERATRVLRSAEASVLCAMKKVPKTQKKARATENISATSGLVLVSGIRAGATVRQRNLVSDASGTVLGCCPSLFAAR